MVAFYKHDISSWRGGTASLSHEEYRVYHVIVEQMMIEEGPIIVHERALAGSANMSLRAFKGALQSLISRGKLAWNGDRITNFRVESEMKIIRKNRDNARTGGQASGEARRNDEFATEKSNKNNDGAEAALHSDTKPKREEESREEESREDKKEPFSPPFPGGDADPDSEEPENDDSEYRPPGKVARSSQGTRLEPDAEITAEMLDFATQRGLSVSEAHEIWLTFRDYWVSQVGQKGRKANWFATWRNWVRREIEHLTRRGRIFKPEVKPDRNGDVNERVKRLMGKNYA